MKTHPWIGVILSLIVPPVAFVLGQTNVVPTDWRISTPVTHQNLAVFFIHGKDVQAGKKFLSLQEALAKKQMIVHETGSVNELAVENVSPDHEVFIQAGDIVKGGRQDRVFSYDLIVPVQSGRVRIASFCVEAGRWQRRGAEDAQQFSASTGQLPGKALRLAVHSARHQGQVWEKVKEQQDKLGRRLHKTVADPQSPSSLQLTLEDKDLQAKVDAYVAKLEKSVSAKDDVVGVVFAINGKVEGAEVYGCSALFRMMWPKLLRTAAVDAFAELLKGRRYELADIDEVAAFLAETNSGKRTDTAVTPRIRVTRREGAAGVVIETSDQEHQSTFIHRSYIAR